MLFMCNEGYGGFLNPVTPYTLYGLRPKSDLVYETSYSSALAQVRGHARRTGAGGSHEEAARPVDSSPTRRVP